MSENTETKQTVERKPYLVTMIIEMGVLQPKSGKPYRISA